LGSIIATLGSRLGSLANRSRLSYSRVDGGKEQLMPLARTLRTTLAGIAAWIVVASPPVCAQTTQTHDKVSIGTNWVAEAEHGGFYQALADGTYRKYGLDVNIVQGGPNTNNRILLPVGKLDFYLSANTLQGFDAVAENIPTVEVAALFQKDPQVLIAHPDPAAQKFTDLKNLTLFISKEGMATYFQWLKADYGFSESRVKPYTFNPQPFLADKKSAMQGYVTSEPFAIEKAAHFKPKVFLLADQGFSTYSTLIETRRDLVDKNPGLVQRFVDATIIGWYHYIYSRNALGNELIKNQNPEMTDDLLAYSVAAMKQYGIVDSGDSSSLGIGAMTDARMKGFFDEMVRAGVVKPDLDYRKAYTLQFVDKKVGLDLRPKP
jgi:NitT/TauT family transport system substrate-binding protein